MKLPPMNTVRRDSVKGFTLIEMTIAVVLLTIVIGNVYWLLQKSTQAMGSKNVAYDVDTQARRAMDRITMAIIGATKDDLMDPLGQPNYTSWPRPHQAQHRCDRPPPFRR